jgi:hypothetical protein
MHRSFIYEMSSFQVVSRFVPVVYHKTAHIVKVARPIGRIVGVYDWPARCTMQPLDVALTGERQFVVSDNFKHYHV